MNLKHVMAHLATHVTSYNDLNREIIEAVVTFGKELKILLMKLILLLMRINNLYDLQASMEQIIKKSLTLLTLIKEHSVIVGSLVQLLVLYKIIAYSKRLFLLRIHLRKLNILVLFIFDSGYLESGKMLLLMITYLLIQIIILFFQRIVIISLSFGVHC